MSEPGSNGTDAEHAAALARGWDTYMAEPRMALRLADGVLSVGVTEADLREASLLRGCALAHLGEFSRCQAMLGGRPELEVEFPVAHQVRRALLALGTAEFRGGNSVRAFSLWERAMCASISQGDYVLEGYARIQMGIAWTEQSRASRAVDCFLAALVAFEAVGFQRGIAIARGNLGNVMLQIGEHSKAAEHFLAGLAILEALNDRRGRAIGLASLGRVRMRSGSLADGVERMSMAAREFQELGLRLEEAIALYYLGDGMLQMGQAGEAVGPLRAALALSEATGSFQYSVLSRMRCAEALAASDDVEGAAILLEHCLGGTVGEERTALRAQTLLTVARLRAILPGEPAWHRLPGREEALRQATALAADVAVLSEAHEQLALHFESVGDPVSSLFHYKAHLRHAKLEAEERGKQAVARAEVELTLDRLRREHELAVENNRRLEEALDEARREHARADAASRGKSTLLSIVAHDLRSPLTHIALTAEDLAHERDEARRDAELRGIHLAAHRASRLIHSLLDGAAADEGRLRVKLEPFDLADVVNRLCRQLDWFARQKDQALQVEYDEGVIVHADVQRVEQVVQNLVDNAIKFSSRGARTTVAVRMRGGRVTLTVSDQGPGMSAADRATAFDRFVVGGAAPTARETSTGLGLAITRQLVEAMAGTVDVASDGPGTGCTFTVVLPAGSPVGERMPL